VVKNGVQLCTKEAGTVLGEMSFLGRALATADVAVDCDGLQVFQMSEEYLNDVFQNQSRLCSKFYWNLAKQLAELLVSCDTPTFTVQASVCVSLARSFSRLYAWGIGMTHVGSVRHKKQTSNRRRRRPAV